MVDQGSNELWMVFLLMAMSVLGLYVVRAYNLAFGMVAGSVLTFVLGKVVKPGEYDEFHDES